MIEQVCAELGDGFDEVDITGDPELMRDATASRSR